MRGVGGRGKEVYASACWVYKRQRERETDRERQRETDRKRQTETDRQTERGRERERSLEVRVRGKKE